MRNKEGHNKTLTTADIEIAVARFLNPRINVIVPNVSWGFGLRHECDLLVVSPLGYAMEIEIKTSRSDIKADQKKGHRHISNKIKRFSFAVPDYLVDCPELPKDCGLIAVDQTLKCETLRPPRINKSAGKLTDKQILKLLHLGCQRIWSLKEAVIAAKMRKKVN